jgi:hypothetical protein
MIHTPPSPRPINALIVVLKEKVREKELKLEETEIQTISSESLRQGEESLV